MISYPFESLNAGTAEAPVYDRAITAEQERLFNKLRYANGVFNTPADGLQVVAAGGMMINVQPGGCHIEGALGYQAEALSFELTVGGSAPRIDRVVARFNTSISARNIDIIVMEGVPGATPKAPEITRESNYYEIALADIRVNAGATYVGNANITDQRLNADLCGLVVPAIPTPLDLTALYTQYQDSLEEFLELVASTLDETTAGYLQNQITAIRDAFNGNLTPVWENASPASAFAAQEIEMELDEDDMVMVQCTPFAAGLYSRMPASPVFLNVGEYGYAQAIGGAATFGQGGIFLGIREIYASETGVRFGGGYEMRATDEWAEGDRAVIPYRIYVIKGVR